LQVYINLFFAFSPYSKIKGRQPAVEDLTGKRFGSFQIVAPLGEGGMAAVYKAYQPAMERFVALKVLPRHMSTSEEFTARFRREARLVAQLQHPHILPVFDYGESEGYPYIVMPFIVSGTLADILRKQRVTLPEARRILSQIGDALAYAHARGMIHRDVKPSNILIDERGNCLLTDFGLARMAEAGEKLTTSGSVMGTPAYMSPEQGMGSGVDQRSDLYSLGVILYEMLTGRVPYTAETPIAVVFKHVQDPLPSARKFNPSLTESLELVLLKCLAKNPAERYQNAEAFVQAVQQVISENPAADKTLSQKITPILSATEKQAVLEERVAVVQSGPISRPPIVRSARWLVPVWALTGIGAIALVVIVAAAMRSRSNTPPIATATSSIPPTLTLTATPALINLVPSAAPTSTVNSEPSLGPTGEFRDEFDGQLGEGWTWLAEDPARWSLSEEPGWLQIMASDASLDGPSFPANLLVRDAPPGDFEVTTFLRFAPARNFQFAGLIIFQEKANALQYGRAFCDLPDTCSGGGIYFDNFENGSITGSSPMISMNSPDIYLRLRRLGATYTAYYSEDGENWTLLGEHVRDFPQPQIGLMAAQAAEQIPAAFDYFTLTSLKD
jgi:serine/threonine protein kinase